MNDPANLGVATDDRIEFATARFLGEVPAVFRECLVLVLGILVGDLRRAADIPERFENRRRGHADLLGLGDAEQQVLGADVLVFEFVGVSLR